MDAVVEGTVLRSGDQVRITAQLIEASTDNTYGPRAIRVSCVIIGAPEQVARAIAINSMD